MMTKICACPSNRFLFISFACIFWSGCHTHIHTHRNTWNGLLMTPLITHLISFSHKKRHAQSKRICFASFLVYFINR
jgi:hypothetical protein